MLLRYLVHESQRWEIHGRQMYLYDVFHLFFLPLRQETKYISLSPIGHVDLNILFITGHINQVYSYISENIDTIPEDIIVATTCFPQKLSKYKRKKTIFVPDTRSNLCFIHRGEPYGFLFDITDAELDFYNATGSIIERLQSTYSKL